MRIISGEYSGRKLKSLPGNNTRPTTDKVKESIFNIIGPYFDGGICLDLYAGSGALAIEAVSRGMDKAILFEKDRKAQQVIQNNILITKEMDKFQLVKGDSKRGVYQLHEPIQLIFLDPPYAKQTIEKDLLTIVSLNLITSDTIAVCETDSQIFLPDKIGPFIQWKRAVYGATAVSFYHIDEVTNDA